MPEQETKFIDFSANIKIPVQEVKFSVCTKEDKKLDVVTFYILNAIHRNDADERQIAEATLLGKSVIAAELEKLEKQGLIEKRGDGLKLTKNAVNLWLGNHLPEVISKSSTDLKLNLVDKTVCNTPCGSLVEGDECIRLHPKYFLDEFVMNDSCIRDTFIKIIGEEENNSADIIYDSMKDSLYVDLEPKGQIAYTDFAIKRLPCWSQGKSLKDMHSDSLIAKGEVLSRTYAAGNGNAEYHLYFDTVSGQIFFDLPQSEYRKSNLNLPQVCSVSPEMEQKFVSALKEQYGLPEDSNVILKNLESIAYYVDFQLTDLTGEKKLENSKKAETKASDSPHERPASTPQFAAHYFPGIFGLAASGLLHETSQKSTPDDSISLWEVAAKLRSATLLAPASVIENPKGISDSSEEN